MSDMQPPAFDRRKFADENRPLPATEAPATRAS
jgi:hypothetical protein